MPTRTPTQHQRLIAAGQRQTPEHAERQHPDRGQARRTRSHRRWHETRTRFAKAYPTCIDPLGIHPGRIEPTEEIHHIQPAAQRPDLVYDRDNLAPLCRACHHRIEAMHRAGKPTQQYFESFQQNRERHEQHPIA